MSRESECMTKSKAGRMAKEMVGNEALRPGAATGIRERQEAMILYDKVSFTPGGQRVLEDFRLEVRRGEKVLVYGKSGVGKSTLLRMLLGFVLPSSGCVYFEGRRIDPGSVWEARRRIAYVSQDLDLSRGKAGDFVAGVFALRANRGRAHMDEDFAAAMEWLELDRGILDKGMTDLSGGERQRLALALALSLGRDVFLLDEVTSAVDPRMKERIARRFASMESATVLAVSHDVTWLKVGGMRVVRLGD
ncbi:ABC transporter ATP-binding protein [Candidatus Solincola sp.]|nr:ATP-binding cassette domain-containing protein [Actinomycetota bacterium]